MTSAATILTKGESVVDPARIRRFYEAGLLQHGRESFQALRWTDRVAMEMGYRVVSGSPLQNWEQHGSILDIGSGHGDILPVLRQERNFRRKYVGVEIMPEYCITARRRHREDTLATFICDEFLHHDFEADHFDWVISLGGMNVKQPNQEQYDHAVFAKMRALARDGFSVYLLDKSKATLEIMGRAPEMAFHNIGEVVEKLQQEYHPSAMEIKRYPNEESRRVILHLKF